MGESEISQPRVEAPVPMRAGVSLKAQHYRMVIDRQPDVGWFEVHPENYMGAGGPPLGYLERIRRDYPLSLHSVGTSLGSHLPLDRDHLGALKELVDRFEPCMVSEHLSWSHGREWYTHDLLPLRYTEDALNLVVAHIDQVQEVLQRKILIENPSTYLQFRDSEMKEQDFLAEAARRSGAGLLLDINNVYVSCCNHGWDIEAYLSAIPAQLVGEIHLAGHSVQALRKGTLRLDDHGSAVCDEVWNLYKDCIQTMGPVRTLIERDSNIPEFTALLGEAAIADQALTAAGEKYEAAV